MNKPQKKTSFTLKEQGQILVYLFSFAKKYVWTFALSVGLMMVASAFSAYLPLIIQTYIDKYLTQGTATIDITVRVALTYLLILVIRMGLVYAKDFSFKMASERTVAQMRNTIYDKVTGLSLDYFNQTPNGEVVSRITNDTETIKEFWNVFLTFFDGIINAIMIGIAMFSLSASLSWVFMAFIPLVVVLVYVYQKISTRVYRRMRRALSTVNAQIAESTMGMWLIQQFNQTDRMKKEFNQINQEYVTARHNMFKMNALLLMPAVNLIEQLVLIAVIWIFGRNMLAGELLDVGLLYAFTSYSKSFFHPIGGMLDSLSIYQDGLVSASRGMTLMANPAMAPSPSDGAGDYEIAGQLGIEDLTFSYDGQVDVLKNLDMEAQAGQMIAIVGHTGSGKSTIINLLMRFYEFENGKIEIDGRPIRDYSQEALRSQMGLVQQDAFMFYGNFIDNIRLHGDYSDEEVMEAARFTGADDFISRLEEGYQTMVSEGGTSLSAGQKQLINIARTILRKPKILILDEATANIDTESEQYIQASLKKIRQNSTLVVIAHRLSTIKDADKIYVLHKGKICEAGNHDELIAKQGTYYDMYRLQTLQGVF